MKSMSARASRAPAPTRTEKRDPAIFTARSKSMMPSAGPRSQCARGSKGNDGGSPQRRTSRFSAGPLPTGTLGWGRLGSVRRRLVRRYSRLSSSISSCLICAARCLFAA